MAHDRGARTRARERLHPKRTMQARKASDDAKGVKAYAENVFASALEKTAERLDRHMM